MGTQTTTPPTTTTPPAAGSGEGEGEGTGTGTPPPPAPPGTPTPDPATPPTPGNPGPGQPSEPVPPSQHRQPVHAFRVNGGEVHDYAAVQAHIDTLEGFRSDTVAMIRKDFIDDLATRRIIGNPQRASLHALVQTMTPEQFTTFKESYAGATPAALFGKVSDDGTGEPGVDPRVDRIAVLERIIHNHRHVHNMPEERIQQTQTWKQLQELKAAQA